MMNSHIKIYVLLLFAIGVLCNLHSQNLTKFAFIGDFGWDGQNELAVANLVKSWNPEFIITVGDDYYDNGAASTIDKNIGKYYHDYIKPYLGTYGSGSPDINRFWPVPGNHDWRATNLQLYLDYFTLPNNERYYDFVVGDVHF
jgi:tartrate-resistant acid phosphatase type 5